MIHITWQQNEPVAVHVRFTCDKINADIWVAEGSFGETRLLVEAHYNKRYKDLEPVHYNEIVEGELGTYCKDLLKGEILLPAITQILYTLTNEVGLLERLENNGN